MSAQPMIKTSVLILSDTHGMKFDMSDVSVDVVVHCGDLTDGSKIEEFRATIGCLSQIKSPLKLAIAGNHDLTLDVPAFEKKVSEASPPLDPELVAREYGRAGEARMLFEEAQNMGVVLLDEGNHQFTLVNGASLNIHASPYTPSMGEWGFQYHPERGHDFSMAKGTDIIITHGPPKGIMDYTYGRERAGCPYLFEAVSQAKPRIHCFGHIHEGWGAKRVVWRETFEDRPTHFTAIDNDKSTLVEKLSTLEPSRFDSSVDLESKQARLAKYKQDGCIKIDQSSLVDLESEQLKLEGYKWDGHTRINQKSSDNSCDRSSETLFVNASMSSIVGELSQLPWVVYVDLSAAV